MGAREERRSRDSLALVDPALNGALLSVHMVQDPSDLLRLPLVDLAEAPLSELAALLRRESLPNEAEMAALDQVVATRVLMALRRAPDVEALRAEADALRRVVPHRARRELDARERPWAARVSAWADLVDLAAAAAARKDPVLALSLAHAPEILAAVTATPGLSQSDLGERLGLKPANVSRIVAVLEANGLVRREVRGREKRLFPAERAVDPANNEVNLWAGASSRGISCFASERALG